MSDPAIFPATTTMTVGQALASATQQDLKEVVIVGIHQDGSLCVRSSRMNREDMAWFCQRGILYAHGVITE